MAFCTECGHQLANGAKFCSQCGAQVSAPAANEGQRRKEQYDGTIHKCPNCGEILNSFAPVCPTCGYEIRGSKASDTITGFFSKLENSETEAQKIELIRNFPIPNTKEDVIEFMVLASSNVLKQSGAICEAWQAKFEQCYQKAKLLLSNEDMHNITVLYEDTNKKIRANNLMQGTKRTGKLLGNVFTAVIKKAPQFLGFLAKNGLSVFGILAYLKAIQMDQLGENGAGFQLLGGILSVASAGLLLRKTSTFLDVAFVVLCGLSSFYLADFLDNGVLLRLMGVVTLFFTIFSFVEKVSSGKNAKGD